MGIISFFSFIFSICFYLYFWQKFRKLFKNISIFIIFLLFLLILKFLYLFYIYNQFFWRWLKFLWILHILCLNYSLIFHSQWPNKNSVIIFFPYFCLIMQIRCFKIPILIIMTASKFFLLRYFYCKIRIRHISSLYYCSIFIWIHILFIFLLFIIHCSN